MGCVYPGKINYMSPVLYPNQPEKYNLVKTFHFLNSQMCNYIASNNLAYS
jgi:hypothetical protein